jgi:hypothetical protein
VSDRCPWFTLGGLAIGLLISYVATRSPEVSTTEAVLAFVLVPLAFAIGLNPLDWRNGDPK